MTFPAQDAAGTSLASDPGLQEAHARLMADRSLQFERADMPVPEVSPFFRWLTEVLGHLAPFLVWGFWIGLAVVVLLIVWLLVRELFAMRRAPDRPTPPPAQPETWQPTARDARDLLADADALAAAGQYAEAAHLILLRSVADIERRLPRAVKDSLTSREIAALPALPEAARSTFGDIARLVEISLFGGKPVVRDDYASCRAAYEAFALPGGRLHE